MKHLLLCAIAVIALAGCKKKADGIVGTWKIKAAAFSPAVSLNGTYYNDAYALLYDDACEQDNKFIFKSNGEVVEDQGALKCDTTAAQQSTANYTLNGNVLTIISSTDTTMFTDVGVTETQLWGSLATTYFGQQTDIIITWKRQ